MRPPSGAAKLSSIPRSPAIRKSSPTPPIPARSSSSPIRKSATTEPAPPTTSPRVRTLKAWWSASFRRIASNWRSDAAADTFLAQRRRPDRQRSRHARAGPPPAHPRRHARRALVASKPTAQKLVEKARSIPTMAGLDLASRVSTPEALRVDRDRGAVFALRPHRAPGRAPLQRGGLRFRHQAQHPAPPGACRLPRHRGAVAAPARKTCWRSIPTASSSPTVPAIRSRSSRRSATSAS